MGYTDYGQYQLRFRERWIKHYFVTLKNPLATKKGMHTHHHHNVCDTKRFGLQVQSWCRGGEEDQEKVFPLEKPGEDPRSDGWAEFGGLDRCSGWGCEQNFQAEGKVCLRHCGKKEKCAGCNAILQQLKAQLAGIPVWGGGVVEEEAGGWEGQLSGLLAFKSGSKEGGQLGNTLFSKGSETRLHVLWDQKLSKI